MSSRFLKFSVFAFVIGGLILLLGRRQWFPDFYEPRFMGVASFLHALLILLIFFISNPKRADSFEAKVSSINLQKAVAFSMLMDGAGGLGLFELYKFGFEYDKLLHFAISFVLLISFTEFLSKRHAFQFGKSIFWAVFLIFSVGVFWEISEYFTDILFGTKTFGMRGRDLIRDTRFDLILNTFGIIAGIVISALRHKRRGLTVFK